MKLQQIKFFLILILPIWTLKSQTIQFQFCGKTTAIPTLDKEGNDQRSKSAVKLDFLKIGVRGASQTAPFYVLGNEEAVKTNENFSDQLMTDKCASSPGTNGNCSLCNVCTTAISTSSQSLGTVSGKIMENVKVESKGNDIYIMCTGDKNVVCYETHKISLAGYSNKKIDVFYKVEGIASLDPNHLKNISLNYRYNNEAYFSTPYFFNKNSSNVGAFEAVGSIQVAVPIASATEILSKDIKFAISPSLAKESITVKFESNQSFDGYASIYSTHGISFLKKDVKFSSESSGQEIEISELVNGTYFLYLSDLNGQFIGVKPFVKE